MPLNYTDLTVTCIIWIGVGMVVAGLAFELTIIPFVGHLILKKSKAEDFLPETYNAANKSAKLLVIFGSIIISTSVLTMLTKIFISSMWYYL